MERTEKAIQDDDGTVGDATVENIPDQRSVGTFLTSFSFLNLD
jgi:hypothetical protein